MPRSFNIQALRGKLPKSLPELGHDPRTVMRIVLGALLLANLVAALVLFKPWAGSLEDLQQQEAALRQQTLKQTADIVRLKSLVSKVQTARTQGEEFESKYFMVNRTESETIMAELERASRESGIRMGEVTFGRDPVEGTDDLTIMTINANFQGTFADLMHLVNELDRSPRFLILDTLAAAPQQSGMALSILIKMNALVREQGNTEVAQAR